MAILAISLPRLWASPIWLCCEVLHSSYVTLRAIIAATARLPAVCCSRWIIWACEAPRSATRGVGAAVVSGAASAWACSATARLYRRI